MSRKTLYYTVNLIVPTGLMSILICMVFCLPTGAGEKMTLCMSVLLALNLFQLLVTRILPPTSSVVPLIAKYLLFTFTLNVLVIGRNVVSSCLLSSTLFFPSEVNTVIITNFYYRTPMTHNMPPWLRWFFLQVLPPYLLMSPRQVEDFQRRPEDSNAVGQPCHAFMNRILNRRSLTSAYLNAVMTVSAALLILSRVVISSGRS